jgi:hypothetical protein
MPLRRLLTVICCSAVLLAAFTPSAAQLPLRALRGESADASTTPQPLLSVALSLPPTQISSDVWIRPFTTSVSTQIVGWPGLSSSTVALLSQESLLDRAFAPLQAPSLQLWGRLPDGGLVRWIGTRMEYDAPMWEIR